MIFFQFWEKRQKQEELVTKKREVEKAQKECKNDYFRQSL
ncbi:hypothetical protein H1P_190053 [Hyella patelloides LEGE 07179]|uniref:Uncharacterized protein n=1 Tax=Hyella patelloides LEGE 07179 TaxID=945734 RepID=A0A563VPB4_9CYAN|nr:hypothetical protein H1P_190053 [Hyella patelloides LEGE 07179]